MTREILAFHLGHDIVGVLNLASLRHAAFRGNRKFIGAQRLVDPNGNRYDLPRLARLLGKTFEDELRIQARHDDMREIASIFLWPPTPGATPITRQGLLDTNVVFQFTSP